MTFIHRWLILGSCSFVVGATLAAQDAPLSSAQLEFFESRIRPVLVEHCYACHNSAENAEAGLALDCRDATLRGGDGGRVIVPGDPQASQLIAVLRHQIEGLEMPDGGPKLDDLIIRDFEKWITMGAPDPRQSPPSAAAIAELTSWEATLQRRKQWWSFRPIQFGDPPLQSLDATLAPIDRFVRTKIQQNGLQPSPPADAETLIRRMFIHLIGLPPTVEEIRVWAQRFEEGYELAAEELCNHLLASDRFGERWARHWMDWIRYAESHGSEGDPAIDNAWYYRDYLIRALNRDVPYDQLVREHVAGDLLRSPRVNSSLGINESAIGPAHWRMVFHGFAPTDALDEKVRFIDDQVNAFSKAFLGLTVSCARCHDHKFDAISQADYYAIFGILAARRPGRTVIDTTERQSIHRQRLAQRKPRVRSAIASDWMNALPTLKQRLQSNDFVDKSVADSDLYSILRLSESSADQSIRQAWETLLVKQPAMPSQAASEAAWNLAETTALEKWYANGIGLAGQPSKPGEFAIAPQGEFALLGIYPAGVYSHTLSTKHAARLTSPDIRLPADHELYVRAIGDGEAALRYVIQDYPRNGTVFPVRTLQPKWQWIRFEMDYWAGDDMHVELVTAKDAPLLVKNQDRSWFGVTEVSLQPSGTGPPLESRGVLSAVVQSTSTIPESHDSVVDVVITAIEHAIEHWNKGQSTDEEALLLDECIRLNWLPNRIDALHRAAPLIAEYRGFESEIPVPTRVPGLDETTGRTQPLFVRGNHKKPLGVVPPRFLEAIDATPYPASANDRLRLAEDLLREDNPLTRRVIVNRVWHHLFGRGIVATTDNFGRLGSLPSHPELLDWLAVDFSNQGWSLKQLIRSIVTSRTWQQAAVPSPQAKRLDPGNVWLSHANLRRMEAEVIRDSLLVVTGQLDRESMAGPPVDGDSPRRSIYVNVIRNSLDPFLRAFDFPEPFSTVGRRDVTNVPAQSLTMMNAPQIGQFASELAEQLVEDPNLESDVPRLERLFLTLFSRTATPAEIQQTEAYLNSTRQLYRDYQQRRRALQDEIDSEQTRIASIIEPVRQRLGEDDSPATAGSPGDLQPIAQWTFDDGLVDSIGSLPAVGHAGATVRDGMLVLPQGAYVTTAKLPQALTTKTLEAWVQLDNLTQRGGGVMTLQTTNGNVFDSIVFAEREPGHWLAGSNHFARTESFEGPPDQEAANRMVHFAIVYHADGTIVGYRDGEPYGKPYQSSGPIEFEANDAIVSFGVRHLPAGGNRMLAGRIDRANLYDRALTEIEIKESFAVATGSVSRSDVLAAMSAQQRAQVESAERRIVELESAIASLPAVFQGSAELAAWADMTQGLLMLQEFIYVR